MNRAAGGGVHSAPSRRPAFFDIANEGFPRKGQILPAPGRNVTEGDKEGNGCHRR